MKFPATHHTTALVTRGARLVPVAFAAAGISFGAILLTAPGGNADPGQVNASCDLAAAQCQINGQQIGMPTLPSHKDERQSPAPTDPGPGTLPADVIADPVHVEPVVGPEPVGAPGTPPPVSPGNGQGGVTVGNTSCTVRDHRDEVARAGWNSGNCSDPPPTASPGNGQGGVTVGDTTCTVRDHRDEVARAGWNKNC
jgi:hypothetical protein